MAASARTILLKGKDKGHHEEGAAGTVVSPGMHVTLASDGTYGKSAETTAELVKSGVFIVLEDQHQGKTITGDYAIGDVLFMYKPVAGDHLNLLVKSGENIAVGDKLIAEGSASGLFIEKAGSEAAYKAQARESTGGALAANDFVACEWMGS